MSEFWRNFLGIRYEEGAWPLYRVDKGLRYGLKSILHQQRPLPEDRRHFEAMHRYLASQSITPTADAALTLRAVGDVMWIPRGWGAPLAPEVAAWMAEGDFRCANLETPVDATRPVPRATYAAFNAPGSFIDLWNEEIGRTMFSLCNNHALDQGLGGLERTMRALSSRQMDSVGGPDASDACVRIQVGQASVAVVAFTYGLNPWGHDLRGAELPEGLPRIHPFGDGEGDGARLESLMSKARSLDTDLIVVLPHWGFEFEYWPEARQRAHAYRLVELGADLVVGSSPHVLQPIDVVSVNHRDAQCPVQVERPGGARLALIAYSLGNFLSSMPTSACRTGGVLALGLGASKSAPLDLRSVEFRPSVSVRDLRGCHVEALPRGGRRHSWRQVRSTMGRLADGPVLFV